MVSISTCTFWKWLRIICFAWRKLWSDIIWSVHVFTGIKFCFSQVTVDNVCSFWTRMLSLSLSQNNLNTWWFLSLNPILSLSWSPLCSSGATGDGRQGNDIISVSWSTDKQSFLFTFPGSTSWITWYRWRTSLNQTKLTFFPVLLWFFNCVHFFI